MGMIMMQAVFVQKNYNMTKEIDFDHEIRKALPRTII